VVQDNDLIQGTISSGRERELYGSLSIAACVAVEFLLALMEDVPGLLIMTLLWQSCGFCAGSCQGALGVQGRIRSRQEQKGRLHQLLELDGQMIPAFFPFTIERKTVFQVEMITILFRVWHQITPRPFTLNQARL
jgi:hypothetical protein